jgi:ubiquinone/menaquinone biosynthesis C-methylase UbiE
MKEDERSMTGSHASGNAWESAVSSLLGKPEHSALVSDCYFDGTAAEAGERYWQSSEWKAVQDWLPRSRGTVLDVAAGRGIASYAMARDGWRVTALEPNPSDLVGAGAIRQMSASSGFDINVIEGMGEQLPFECEQFDLIFARQALHHAGDLGAFCNELFRVLKPGGRLVAIRDHVISRPRDLAKFYLVHPLHKYYGGENAYLLHEYIEHLRDTGFRLTKILGPFSSVINYAPYDTNSLIDAIVSRVPNICSLRRVAKWSLAKRRLLNIALIVLGAVDHRPGRLYSFIADKHVG